MDTVKLLGGSPLRCRCDLGTENSKLEELQTFFTVVNGPDAAESSYNCFMYWKGTANQCIEAWWSILLRQAPDWWIHFFKNLRYDGLIRDHDAMSMERVGSFSRVGTVWLQSGFEYVITGCLEHAELSGGGDIRHLHLLF